MRILLMVSACLALITAISACDAGHGHSHDDKSSTPNHKSID